MPMPSPFLSMVTTISDGPQGFLPYLAFFLLQDAGLMQVHVVRAHSLTLGQSMHFASLLAQPASKRAAIGRGPIALYFWSGVNR